MRTKLKFLIKQSLKKKIDTKWFKIANILILILLIGVLNLDRIISFFGGDFENVTKIYVIDEINAFDSFKYNFETISSPLEDFGKYEIIESNKAISELKNDIKNKDDIIINIKFSETNYIEGFIISYNQINTLEEQIISSSLNNIKSNYVLATSGLSKEEINALTSPVNINKEVTNEELNGNTASKDIISSGLIVVFIIPFFILITMLTQMIGAEINDEKSTRGMEIIISNVSPTIHFISKIISSTLFVIMQALVLFGDILIAFLIRKLLGASLSSNIVNNDSINIVADVLNSVKDSGILDLLLKGLPIIIIMFILSFIIYAIVAGVLASMTTNIEDYQQLQTPLMLILMVGYYIAIMASAFEGALFVKIVSYVPMLSFLIAPVIYLLGQISLLELFASTLLCGVTTVIFFYFGLRIYKVGILNYSSKDLWKKIFKSLKNH